MTSGGGIFHGNGIALRGRSLALRISAQSVEDWGVPVSFLA